MTQFKTDKVVTIEGEDGEKFEQTLGIWDDMDMRLEVVGASGCGKSGMHGQRLCNCKVVFLCFYTTPSLSTSSIINIYFLHKFISNLEFQGPL